MPPIKPLLWAALILAFAIVANAFDVDDMLSMLVVGALALVAAGRVERPLSCRKAW